MQAHGSAVLSPAPLSSDLIWQVFSGPSVKLWRDFKMKTRNWTTLASVIKPTVITIPVLHNLI